MSEEIWFENKKVGGRWGAPRNTFVTISVISCNIPPGACNLLQSLGCCSFRHRGRRNLPAGVCRISPAAAGGISERKEPATLTRFAIRSAAGFPPPFVESSAAVLRARCVQFSAPGLRVRYVRISAVALPQVAARGRPPLVVSCRRSAEVPPQDFLVGEFRTVQFNLNLFAVNLRVSGGEEGNGVFHPLGGGVPLGDDFLEHLALVPMVIHQQVSGAEQGSHRSEGGEVGGGGLDADFSEAAALGGGAIHLEVGGQFSEGHPGDHVEQTSEDETEVVGVSGGVLFVGFGHPVHHGFLIPFPYLQVDYTPNRHNSSSTFLPFFHFF